MKPTGQAPDRLGRYHLGRLLGQGAAGVVHAATHPRSSGGARQVALKVQRTATGLLREAQMTSNLRHPNIVDVYEVGEAEGWSFCAMELCEGGSLAAVGALPPRAVVDVGLQVCAALTYAHEALELVHLDIKPHNLLLDGATVKLADLGIATARGFSQGWTPAGTPEFMAPEQRHGGRLDPRSDLFALGQTLRALLGGGGGSASATLDWFELDGAPHPAGDRTPLPAKPGSLEAILERATLPEASDRWPSAAAMAHALQQCSADGPSLTEHLGLQAHPRVSELGRPPAVRRLFGRSELLDATLTALDTHPLVTLCGGAGVGKTTLAAVALRMWNGEASWVDLSTARTREDLLVAIAQVLEVSLEPGLVDGWSEQLGRALQARRHHLLVLEGVEGVHVHADLLTGWLAQAPELRVLVSSRIVLGQAGEHVLPVGPLSTDAAFGLLKHHAADRGVTVDDGPVARRLVEQLDGLPLAITLAAGRLGVLSLEEVEARLAPGFLRSGDASRHGTLERALDWSWNLLDAEARSALAVLSAFAGPSSRADIEAVFGALSIDADSTLRTLLAHSLVQPSPHGVRLYQQVRAHASDQRARLGLDRSARDAHALHFACLGAREALERLRSAQRRTTLDHHRRCLPNLLAAQAHALETQQHALAGTLWLAALPPLEHSGQCARAEDSGGLISAHLPDSDPVAMRIDVERVRMLGLLGRLTEAASLCSQFPSRHGCAQPPSLTVEQALLEVGRGNYPTALALLQASTRRLEEHGSAWRRAHTHNSLANTLVMLGRLSEATAHQTTAMTISEANGDLHTLATVLGNVGNRQRQQGQLRAASESYDRSLRLHRRDGATRLAGHILGNMAYLYRLQGRLPDALEAYAEALSVARFHGDRTSVCVQLINRSIAQTDLHRLDEAAVGLNEAVALADDAGLAAIAGYARLHLGKVALRRGDTEAAKAPLRAGISTLQNIGAPLLLAEGLSIEAELQLLNNDPEAAQRTLDRARALTPEEEHETRTILAAVQEMLDGS